MQLYLIGALIFSLLVALFAVQNTEMVTVKFLTFQFPISLVLVILGSAVIGSIALYFLGLFKQVGSWFTIRQLSHRKVDLEKQVRALEEKIAELTLTKEGQKMDEYQESGEEEPEKEWST